MGFPYAEDPEKHGIRDIKPFALQRAIYQADDPLVARLCYELDFKIDSQDDPDYLAAREEIAQAVLAWQADYHAGQRLYLQDRASGSLLVRRTPGSGPMLQPLEPAQSAVLRSCQNIASTGKIVAEAGIDEAQTLTILADFEADGVVMREGQKWLCLAVPHNADAWCDSGLDPGSPATDPRPMVATEELVAGS